MKFGHVFKQTLKNEGFPPAWVDSAISYHQLKKCINALANELAQVGLDRQTLGRLLKHVEEQNAAASADSGAGTDADEDKKPLEYLLSAESGNGNDSRNMDGPVGGSQRKTKPFHPKLLFYVNEETGELDSAVMDQSTRKKLQALAVESGIASLRLTDTKSTAATSIEEIVDNPGSPPSPGSPGSPLSPTTSATGRRPGYRTVEIPLTSDSEFFQQLASEVSGLEALQEREEKRMNTEIAVLGTQVAKLTNPDRRASRKMINVWRQIFQVYLENDIFFGTTEADHAGHDAATATERFQRFSNDIVKHGLVDKLKKAENLQALNSFMRINQEILRGLRFGEINRIAMVKILKKFDKRTALSVKSSFPRQITYPSFSAHLAKSVCAQVSTSILTTIPQLDDYSCPACLDIQWRPVRLRCGHVFCIRCLIVMQNNKQDCCPLCREKTVVDACSENLDTELAAYLKKWFPDEVKAKQKYNELMAGIDEYGEVYKEKCVVM